MNWKVAGLNAPGAIETVAVQKFVDIVNEQMKGKMVMTLYPAGQLGDSKAILEMLKAGEVEIHANTASWHTTFVPEWNILAFPYITKDNDHLRRIQKSNWFKDLEAKYYREHGIKILANNGFRLPRHVLHRTKGMITPEDIKGVKIRKADLKIYVKPWQDFGADVTIIPFAETAMALQTGLVSAMGAPAHLIYPQKFYVGAPHITLTGHQRDTFDIFMGKIPWEKVSADTHKILMDAAEKGLAYYAGEMDGVWRDHQAKLKAEGVKIYEADLKAWQAKALAVAEQWEAAGEWQKGLFKMILEM
jgi:TRAP-type C4-dicarboxylate transport system substrate-binding protein